MESSVNLEQKPISAETICNLVGEAINIPTVSKGQPTQFIVLNEIESLSKASEIARNHPITMQALAAIVVCGDLNLAQLKDKWMFDCEAASQQILLSAHTNGLSAHIATLYPDRERIDGMSALLDLPENIVAHSYVTMGFPASTISSCESTEKERIHFNSW